MDKYKSDHSILELKKWPQQNFYFTVSSVVRVFHVYQSITGNDKVKLIYVSLDTTANPEIFTSILLLSEKTKNINAN